MSWLSNDILFYILNLCRYDWVDFPPLPGEIEPRSEAEVNHEIAMGLKHEVSEASCHVDPSMRQPDAS